MLHAIVLAVADVCLASFGWGVLGHFVRTGRPGRGMWAILFLSSFGAAWFEWLQQVHAPAAARGPFLCLLTHVAALALFWSAVRESRGKGLTLAFSSDRPTMLLATGPYAWIRHPFYTSYLAFWLGVAVADGDAVSCILAAGNALAFVVAALTEEAKFRSSTMSAPYAAYSARTGMLLPRLVSLSLRRRRSAA